MGNTQSITDTFDSRAMLLMLLVGFSQPTKALASTTDVFLPALFHVECLQKESQLDSALAYIDYLLEAIRFDCVVGIAFTTFITVALLQLGGIPDPFCKQSKHDGILFPYIYTSFFQIFTQSITRKQPCSFLLHQQIRIRT